MSPDGLGKEDEDDVWLRSMVEFLETVSQTLNPQARRPSCANPAYTNVIQVHMEWVCTLTLIHMCVLM